MSMAVGGGEGGIKADINMTPLIDVLLVLLIIFMVITPLTPKGLETLVPQPPPPGTPPSKADDRTVVIIIEKDKTLKINNEVTTEENQLVVRGRQTDETEREYLHRGIAARQFQRCFVLEYQLRKVLAVSCAGCLGLPVCFQLFLTVLTQQFMHAKTISGLPLNKRFLHQRRQSGK